MRRALALALLLAGCGGGGPGSGSGPTVPVPPPAAPTPPPAPTPEPPLSASCARLGTGNPDPSCRPDAPTFLGDVEAAIATLRAEQPSLFSDDQVLNIGGYYVGLIRILDRRGLCADYDGEELGVTNTLDYSDTFDVLTARNQVRQAYIGTCYPAFVPIRRGEAAPSPAGCTLAPSREIACGREPEGGFYADVSAALDELLKSRPELFDATDLAPGTDWPRVRDVNEYHSALASILVGRGYCARFDGEEIQLKRTNERSEHYDVNYADKYIRTGAGTYRVSCYPAAF